MSHRTRCSVTDGADVVFFRHVLHDEVHGRFLFSSSSSSLVAQSSVVVVGVFCSALMCRATLWVFSFFFFLTAECCCEETFFLGEKWKKMGGKNPRKKKVNAHFVNTNTIRESYRSRPFRRRHGTRERDDEGAESDEMKTMKKKNKTPPSQHNSPTVHHPFSFHCSATCSHGILRCDVCLFFFVAFQSLSLSRVFFTRVEEDGRLNDSSIIDGCTSRRLGDEQGHRNVLEEAKRVVTTRPCDQS